MKIIGRKFKINLFIILEIYTKSSEYEFFKTTSIVKIEILLCNVDYFIDLNMIDDRSLAIHGFNCT